MVIHGTEDSTIPIEHGTSLYACIEEEFKAKPFWALGKGHNDMDYNFDPLIERLQLFLQEHMGDYLCKEKKKKKFNLKGVISASSSKTAS